MSEQKTRYSKDCRICRAEQEAEIQTLQKERDIFKQNSDISLKIIQKLEKQVEAAKTKIKTFITQLERDDRTAYGKYYLVEILEVLESAQNSG